MLELQTTEPKRETPKPVKVVVNGIDMGECKCEPHMGECKCEPHMGEDYCWHAGIYINRMLESGKLSTCDGLIQGFGANPGGAIHDAMVKAREQRDAFTEALAAFEAAIR